jgi:hypothetical protein
MRLKNRYRIVLWTTLAAASLAAFIAPSASFAGTWSPIEELSQFAGSAYPQDLQQLEAPDGSKTVYWVLDDSGSRTLQATRLADDGTPGPVTDVADLTDDDAEDLEAVVDVDGKVTFAWLAESDASPDPDRLKSVQLEADGTVGPVNLIAAPAEPDDTITHLSIAVTPNKTVGYAWRRREAPVMELVGLPQEDGGVQFVWRQVNLALAWMEGLTVPDGGPPGVLRTYSEAPITIASPNIVAMPSNEFKLSWVASDTDTGFGNIAVVGTQNDGTPIGSVSYLFPRTEPQTGIVDGVCQQLRDPDTNQPLTRPSGATGNPRNLEMGANSNGAITMAWRRQIVTGEKDCDGNIPVPESQQLAVETVKGDEFGIFSSIAQASPPGVNVLNLEMNSPRVGRGTLSWFAEDNGSYSTQVFRFSDTGIWTISTDDNFVNPTMITGADQSVGIGWHQGGNVPFQGTARADFLTRGGQLVSASMPGLDALQASSRTLADPGTQGRRIVTFYGLTQADVGGLWQSRFSDPGPRAIPSRVVFSRTLVGASSGVLRVLLQNTGTTPTEVLEVAITGGDASQFRLLDPPRCLGELAPGALCPIELRFSPGSAGSKVAQLRTTTDSGAVSSSLRGQALLRTRLGLLVKPALRTTRAGSKAVYRVIVSNRGGIAATGARVCLNGPGYGVTAPKPCRKIGSIARGRSRVVRFPVRASKSTRPGSYTLLFRTQARNASSVRVPATLQIRP